jgi:hypothetical protein
MIGPQQQQGMVPASVAGFGGYPGFGNQRMGQPGFGQSPMGMMGGSDPASINNGMMALGQQQQQWSAMMSQMMDVMGMFINMMMMKQMQTMMSAMANFGGGGGSGSPGVGNFLGGGSGGGGGGAAPVGGGSSAPSVGSSEFGAATPWGQKLAADAGRNANGPGGYCYKWVAQALARHGVSVHGASAYMAADQLAKSDKFREIKVDPKDLPKLPAGAVVVWNKGSGHPHGHISIALGNGKEASDKLRTQITNYGTSVRVFMPK